MQNKKYAFFDFDGTLISQDSFVLLLKKALRQEPWRIFLLALFVPLFLATHFLKLNKSLAKSCILWSLSFGKGKRESIYFLRNILKEDSPKIWFQEAIPTFERLRSEGIKLIIVSASGQIWLRSLLEDHYSHFNLIIGSKLGFFAGGIVLKSKNCYEKEKLNRIYALLGKDFIWHSSWTDHIADIPILDKAMEKHIICPKKKHLKIFESLYKNNFQLHNWKSQSTSRYT